jgi:4-aminobutyrate aminotransferase-like enzyme
VGARESAIIPVLRQGEGVYLYDDDGKKFLDWTPQAVCSNLGCDFLKASSRVP